MDQTIKDEIRAAKTLLQSQGVDLKAAFDRLADLMKHEAETIDGLKSAGKSVIPEIDFKDVAAGTVSDQTKDEIRHRGTAVIRGVFPRQQAEDWNEELGEYIDRNDYYTKMEEKKGLDNYFAQLDSAKPQIFGIYWSKPQVQARQAKEMAITKAFMNNLWKTDGPNGQEFDPENDYVYADRTRRREPGDQSLGLSPHMDAGSYERWTDAYYQKIYAAVFAGHAEDYDPWNAAYRTKTKEYPSPAVCSMFRTFQGWTALTTQGPSDGTLQVIPVARGITYMLLRALQDDVAPDDLCGAEPGRALRADENWHPDLMKSLVPIPVVEPGDTVWWHPDIVHAVEDSHNGTGYSNVIYIAASPKCDKNAAYIQKQKQSFLEGRSAPDFAAEDYEVNFAGRATLDDLTDLGRRQMGF